MNLFTKFVCAGKIESFSFATAIGIGLVESSINLTKLLSYNNDIKKICFIGSAGAYSKDLSIFDIIESTSCSQIEISALEKKSYTPINLENKNGGIVINSSNYICKDWNCAKMFANKGILLENMEFYAIMQVAKEFNVESAGIFIITNYCDELAHTNFIKNHKMAKEKLQSYILEKYEKYI